MLKLSIVIPCYNEADNIPLILERLSQCIAERRDVEVVLVNNGSIDTSNAVLSRCLAKYDRALFKVVSLPQNNGYGFGILSGLNAASGDVLAWTHADMQTDPKDVLAAFEVFKAEASDQVLVKGKRQNRPAIDRLMTWGMQQVTRLYLKVSLDDINAQPKLFSRAFYELHVKDKAPFDFSLDLYVLYTAHRLGMQCKRIPVVFANRRYGEAKGGGGSWQNRLKLIKRTFAYIKALSRQM